MQVLQIFVFVVIQVRLSGKILNVSFSEACRKYRKYEFWRTLIYFTEIWIMFFVQRAHNLIQELLNNGNFLSISVTIILLMQIAFWGVIMIFFAPCKFSRRLYPDQPVNMRPHGRQRNLLLLAD